MIKVLSLFDGMSCSQIALQSLGIEVDTYYASEVDKYAIEVTQINFPDTVQVGDVTKLDPKDFADVDLIVAGSPCQGFSFAGKQLNFNDPRSALFFEFVRLLKAIKPKYFLLENVRMKKEYQQVITEQVSACYPNHNSGKDLFGGLIEPILINSSLVSAQSRQRLYWTNIPNIKQPEERGIVLRDILETEPEDFTKMSNKFVARNGEKNCMIDKNKKKASNLSALEYVKNGRQGDYLACDDDGKPVDKPKKVGMHIEKVKVRKHEVDITALQYLLREMKAESKKTNRQIAEETNLPITKVEHWFRTDSSFAIPSDDVWFKLKEILGIKSKVFDKQIMEFEIKDGVYETKQRVYSEDGKSPTLTASNTEQMIETKPKQVGIAADVNGHDILKRVYSPDGKSPTLSTCQGGNTEPKVVKGGAFRGRAYDKDGRRMDRDGVSVAEKTKQMLELRKDNKSNAITTVAKDSLAVNEDLTWRKLTPIECERLQTVPDNYTNHVSNTQRYKMLGNGWTIDVICHILKNMD
jgi:DNA-cytosine methyltransferase